MNDYKQVASLLEYLIASNVKKRDIIAQIACECLDWPYVFGAWGEVCTPSGRKRRARVDHPTIVSKCPALNGKSCADCKWGIGVRMFDCRGFTAWLLRQVGLDIVGQGATSQYNTDSNWVIKGPISEMPDCVCCVFRKKGSSMEHTGMHIGGGEVIDCQVNVRSVGMSGWTHYAIPVGLYDEGEIPAKKLKPTIQKGSKGDAVRELQELLNKLGYNCGKVDGIFGARTKEEVMIFQRQHHLIPDGIVGAKTWAALYPDDNAEKTYRVTISGVTEEQLKQILAICPLAKYTTE